MSKGITIDGEPLKVFWRNERGIEQNVSRMTRLGEGKANPFGWSTGELICVLNGDGFAIEHKFGYHYCGAITITDPNYRVIDPVEGEIKFMAAADAAPQP